MRILFDTNVVLDVMLDREPFSFISANLLTYVESGKVSGFLGATTITTIHYLAQKVVGQKQALNEVEKLLKIFEISPIDKKVIKKAIKSDFKDFEDSVLHEAAIASNLDAIVTRNKSDFQKSTIKIFTPQELLDKLINKEENIEK